jgi:hypothetical protein
MTRLHIQVNQTMQFYRAQQGGSAPARLFLSGGASIMPYTAQFFAEKLTVPVEYFNPLRTIQIDPSINLEDLARVAHSLGEVVGLGLRNLAHCPVELNLMPESTLRWQSFNQKKPYLIATVFSLVAVVAAIGLLFDNLAKGNQAALEDLQKEIDPAKRKQEQLDKELTGLKKRQKDADQISAWLDQRYYWADVMTEVREVLVKVEGGMKNRFRTDTGIWVDEFITAAQRVDDPSMAGAAAGADTSQQQSGNNAEAMARFRARYGLGPGRTAAPAPAATPDPAADATGGAGALRSKKKPAGTNEINSITVKFRAVSLKSISPEANKEIFFSVLNEIKNSPFFDPEATENDGQGVGDEEPPGTFKFGIVIGLKRPLKL